MSNFLRTTIFGGFVFLLPFVLLVAIVGKGLSIVHTLATPLLENLPFETIGGLAVAHILPGIILIVVCFLAGLFAGTNTAKELGSSLEKNVLEKVPTYALIRAKLRSVLTPDALEKLDPVMIAFDDSWQFGLEVEKIDGDKHLVYLPGSPDTWSGGVCIVTADRIQHLDLSVQAVNLLMKRLGEGVGQSLSQINLNAPSA